MKLIHIPFTTQNWLGSKWNWSKLTYEILKLPKVESTFVIYKKIPKLNIFFLNLLALKDIEKKIILFCFDFTLYMVIVWYNVINLCDILFIKLITFKKNIWKFCINFGFCIIYIYTSIVIWYLTFDVSLRILGMVSNMRIIYIPFDNFLTKYEDVTIQF